MSDPYVEAVLERLAAHLSNDALLDGVREDAEALEPKDPEKEAVRRRDEGVAFTGRYGGFKRKWHGVGSAEHLAAVLVADLKLAVLEKHGWGEWPVAAVQFGRFVVESEREAAAD